MKTNLSTLFLLVAWLSFPAFSNAQSIKPGYVVSVRELRIPVAASEAFQAGLQSLAKHDPAGSLPHLQRAVDKFATYYEAYYAMGIADLKLWRIADAEQALRKSVEVSAGQYAKSILALGGVLDYEGKFAEAEQVTRTGLGLEPDSWSGHYSLGRALFGLNRLDEAEKNVRESLRQKADSIEALRLLIDIHGKQKNYSAMLEDLNQYLKLDPNSATGVNITALRDAAQRLLVESQNSVALTQAQP